jgi:hypothetical protein
MGERALMIDVRAEETLDLAAACRIAQQLREAPWAEASIDFTATKNFDAFALSVVAQSLAERAGSVSMLGLSQHEVRLLQYLGVHLTAHSLGDPDAD